MGRRQFPPVPPDARAGALIACRPIFRRALHTFLKAAKMLNAHFTEAARQAGPVGASLVRQRVEDI